MSLYYIPFFLLIVTAGFLQAKASEQSHAPDTIVGRDTLPVIFLHEVKVIARELHSSGTSSLIRQEAIQHIQSFSLSDLMQLLPGGTTQAISFKEPGQFTIRALGSNALNALGTGISIDGVRLSVNASLGGDNYFISPGYSGPDTREIATDQIESVEVIRGVPSVRYGDITSGMVLVNTRKTLRPYSFSARLAPEIKSFSADKGWQAGHNGIFNLNAGYTRSNTVNSNQEGVYNRISLATAWLWKKESLSLETGLSGYIIINNNPENLRLLTGEYIKSDNQSLQFRFSGTWELNRPFLTDIQWKTDVSWSYARKKTNKFTSGVYGTGTDATEDREQEGFFIPAQYWLRLGVESQPLYASSVLRARLRKSGIGWNSNTFIGAEWNTDGNRGRGKTYDYHTPELPSQKRYDFRDIPFMHNYAFYAEENFTIKRLTFEGGMRLSGLFTRDRHFRPVVEPRANLSFLVLQQPQVLLKQLRLRAGYGILYKMPSLAYLYAEPDYINFQSYRYRDEASGQGLVVMTTARMDLAGSNRLRPVRNEKMEAGVSGMIGPLAFDVTVFHEQLNRFFYSDNIARPVGYRIYTSSTQAGQKPEYHDGEVFIGGVPVGYTADTAFCNSRAVENSKRERKNGVEFILRTDYITPLATTFVLDGAWLHILSENNGFQSRTVTQSSGNRSYPMCPFYDRSGTAIISQRLNTTLRAVTEIRAWGLTTTIALQAVWMEKSYRKLKSNHAFFMKDANGNRVWEGLHNDANTPKYEIPAGYMDTQGNMHRFTSDLYDRPEYAAMIRPAFSRQFLKDSYSPYFMLNLRVTKDMGKHIRLIFFANNLAKMNAVRYVQSQGLYLKKNPDTFFGAELQIKL